VEQEAAAAPVDEGGHGLLGVTALAGVGCGTVPAVRGALPGDEVQGRMVEKWTARASCASRENGRKAARVPGLTRVGGGVQ
jgi:hypothetical protein